MIFAQFKVVGILLGMAVLLHGGNAREERELIIGSQGVGNERGTVSIQASGSRHFCGGVLIANDMVLTAAHCTVGTAAQSMFIEIGTNRVGAGTRIRGELKTEHGSFNSASMNNDIAIIKLATEARIGFKQIDRGSQSTTSGSATLYGWGFDSSSQVQSLQQRAVLPLHSDDTCINNSNLPTFGYNRVGMMCAGRTGRNACRGDSGGPLYKGGVVIGIASYGNSGCTEQSVFTTVSAYRGWVDRTVKDLRAGIGSRSIDGRCECAGTDDTDVGNYCSNWLSAPVDWCYTENALCANPVESTRYPGKYWTQCVKSEYDLMSADQPDSTRVPDPALGTEDFSKARPFTEPVTTSLEPTAESTNYALVGGVTGAIGLTAVGTAVVLLRRRNRSQEQAQGNFPSNFAAPGLMNQANHGQADPREAVL